MGFHDVPFPTNVSRGSSAGPEIRHSVLRQDSGPGIKSRRWPAARRLYNARHGIRKREDGVAVYEHYLGRGGIENGFPFQDPIDYSTAADHRSAPDDEDFLLDVGDGSKTLFQLKKEYVSGPQTVERLIRKPQTGTVVVALDGVAQAEDTGGGGDFSVDYSTGEILFGVAPLAAVAVTAGCLFWTPCEYADNLQHLEILLSAGPQAISIPDVPIQEQLGDVVTPELPYTGGSSEQSFGADALYDFRWGLFVAATATTTGLGLTLPLKEKLPFGPNVLTIGNIGANGFNLHQREDQALIQALPAAQTAILSLYPSSGAKTWWIAKGL